MYEMPATRSNPNAIKVPANITMPHPDYQENEHSRTQTGLTNPFDENASDTDTERYTSSVPGATGLSIFSDFLHGRLQGHERDLDSSNLDTSLSGDSSFEFSWGGVESEFEQTSTKRVLLLYEHVQCYLYQNSDLTASHLQQSLVVECNLWRKYFPHLRIIGHQLLPCSEDFIQIIETDRLTPYGPQALTQPTNELQLIGSTVNYHESPFNEEIFNQAGVYEEYFAFDFSLSSSGDDKNGKPFKKRSKLPPVSPNSCIKEAIFEFVFEQLWEDLAPLIEPLAEFCRTNRDSQLIASIQSSRTSSGIRQQIPALYNAFPPLPPVFQANRAYNDSILPLPINNINFNKPNPLSILQQEDYSALRNAIQIRSFPLQSLGSVTTSQAPPELPPDPRVDLQYILSPPTTAGTGYSVAKPFQYQQAKPFQRSSEPSTGMSTQHRPRTQGRKGQLRPLATDGGKNSNNLTGMLGADTSHMASQGGQLEGVLIGYKMMLDRLTTPGSQTRSPIPWSKPYKQLPPIEIEDPTIPLTKQRTTKVSFSSRVSSAGLDSAKERKLSEMPKIVDTTRPQTIHGVRSDQNQQDVSSPLTTKRDIHQKLSTPLSPISLRGSGIRGNINMKTAIFPKTTNKQYPVSTLETNGILNSISGVFIDEPVLKQNSLFSKTGADRSKLKAVAAVRGISL